MREPVQTHSVCGTTSRHSHSGGRPATKPPPPMVLLIAGNAIHVHIGSVLRPSIVVSWTNTCERPCEHACSLQQLEAAVLQVLHLAERVFAGRPEEVIVLRTSCELALSKRDVGAALKKLRAVPPSSPLYRAARTAFAEITLRYRNDERQFIAAHVDIVTTFKDYDAHISAGDAFLSIQVCLQHSRTECSRCWGLLCEHQVFVMLIPCLHAMLCSSFHLCLEAVLRESCGRAARCGSFNNSTRKWCIPNVPHYCTSEHFMSY